MKKLFLLFYLIYSCFCVAQNVTNEYSNFECSHSKLVTIPFTTKKKSFINQTVFYEHRDQFSYWYKVVTNENGLVNCIISPINTNDSYVLYIYKYKKEDFCNKVFYGKIKPLKSSSFINNIDDKESFELTDLTFRAEKNEAYYFCVLNTSPSNCGHVMRLITGEDTLQVKAVHIPCSEEELEQQQKINADTVDVKLNVVFQKVYLNVLEENNKTKKVDARVRIKDELTGREIKIQSTGQNTFSLEIEKGRRYMVECIATGYKQFVHTIVISEYVNPDNGTFDLFLRPLRTGDNFVMNNIYFHPNTYALKKGSEKEITYLLNYLKNNPDVKIELQGFTNGNNRINRNRSYRGMGPEWNFEGSSKKLSRYRAESIKKYLVKMGIDESRIKTKGFGGDRMIVENAKTLEAIQKNVRVEVLIM